jgi:hypothetical protein
MGLKKISPKIVFITILILVGAGFRLIPHWPNFTPIAAIALFGGTYLKKKHLAFIIPFAVLFLSDIIIGFHNNMLAVYTSFAIIVLIGFLLRQNVKVTNVIIASLSSSVLFFLITNFSAWLTMPFIYTHDFVGMIMCYTAAIPFFFNGLSGDLFFNGVLFGVFYFANVKFPVLVKERS